MGQQFCKSSFEQLLLNILLKSYPTESEYNAATVDKFYFLLLFPNPLRANFTKWSHTLKKFVGNLPTNCLSVFDHFMGLAVKGLINLEKQELLRKTRKTSKLFEYFEKIIFKNRYFTDAYSEPCQTSKVERFARIANT